MKRFVFGIVLAGVFGGLTACSAPQLPDGYAWNVAPKTDKAFRPEPRASYRYGFDVSRMGENTPAVARERGDGTYDFASALPKPDALARYDGGNTAPAPLYGDVTAQGNAQFNQSGQFNTASAAAFSPADTQVQFNPNAAPLAAPAYTQPEPAFVPAPTAVSRTHTVVKGDSYWKIAKQYYGDPMRFKDIEAANPNKNPNKLQLGETIIIPE